MINKKQDDPPLEWIHPERAMAIWIVSVVLILIASVLFICFARIPEGKVDDINFQFERVQESPLHITKDGLIAQAPAYMFTEHSVLATLTAYNPVEEQCDSTPLITASNKMVREGYVANNCLPFGTMVKIGGKYYEVQDRMNARYGCEYFDILMWSNQEAITFGRQVKEITYYKLVK